MSENQPESLWARSGWMLRIVRVMLALIFIKAVMNPVTHRLIPDIGTDEDEYGRVGEVIGFHYQKNSWWGWRKKTFDTIRFVPNGGPQYLDDDEKWRDVPEEAWGVLPPMDDRDMGFNNRGGSPIENLSAILGTLKHRSRFDATCEADTSEIQNDFGNVPAEIAAVPVELGI